MALKQVKRDRKYNYTLNFLNVKIVPNPGAERYAEVMRAIKEEVIQVKIRGGKTALLRIQRESKEDDVDYIYGMLTKYTKIDDLDWLDITKMERVAPPAELPKDQFPNLAETRYVFVPHLHRIAIVQDANFSINGAHEFFAKAVEKVIREDEESYVIIETSSDVINEILQADAIKYLDVNISYSNADITDGATEWVDDFSRETNASEIQFTFKSGDKGGINSNSELVKGTLGLAQSNGSAEATIIENGKRRKVVTSEHPRKEKMSDKGTEPKNSSIVSKIKSIFRSRNSHDNATDAD
jgi:hypothetical protein